VAPIPGAIVIILGDQIQVSNNLAENNLYLWYYAFECSCVNFQHDNLDGL
jgi:hypothetical protein